MLGELFTITPSNWFARARAGEDFVGELEVSSQSEPFLILASPPRPTAPSSPSTGAPSVRKRARAGHGVLPLSPGKYRARDLSSARRFVKGLQSPASGGRASAEAVEMFR